VVVSLEELFKEFEREAEREEGEELLFPGEEGEGEEKPAGSSPSVPVATGMSEETKPPVKVEEAKAPARMEEVRVEAEKVKLPIEEETDVPVKSVWLIFGDKGTGKTVTALSFPGHILVLSFDRKSNIIKHTFYSGDARIRVFDVVKLMDYSAPEKMLEGAERTYEALIELLDAYPKVYGNPDWVVIDGAQIMQQICEWTMRKRHNIGPFDGISNLNLWKERRAYMRNIHNKALNIARKGVIYTTYVEKDRLIISGEVVHEKDVPAWVDVLIYETDYVLQTMYDPLKKAFEVKVVTSKNDKLLPSGQVYNVTGRRFWEVVGRSP
jgi:archaellum biogenesis ATPase FlaH